MPFLEVGVVLGKEESAIALLFFFLEDLGTSGEADTSRSGNWISSFVSFTFLLLFFLFRFFDESDVFNDWFCDVRLSSVSRAGRSLRLSVWVAE